MGIHAGDVNLRGAADSALLTVVDRLLRSPGADSATRLDLDEDQCAAVGRDQIDFGTRRAEIALQDPVAVALQIALGVAFAAAAESLPPAILDDPREAAQARGQSRHHPANHPKSNMPNRRETKPALPASQRPDFARDACYDFVLMAQKRISREQVIHVSELARIELTDSELSQLETDLSNILGYIDKLNQLDTAAVEPTLQVGDPGTLWREDAVTNHPEPEAMLQNAPAREGRFFKVPKIID